MADTKQTIGSWVNDPSYVASRNTLLQTEGYKNLLYLDHRGIPTIGLGWAFIATPNKFSFPLSEWECI